MPTGLLELRSLTKSAIPADPNPGMGLFEDSGNIWVGPWQWRADLGTTAFGWQHPLAITGIGGTYTDLGSDPFARMSLAARNALADKLGLDRVLLPDSTLADILAHYIFGTLGDPTGINRVKPYGMSPQGYKILMGPFGFIVNEPFSRNHPNYDAMLAIRWADYRRNAQAGISQAVLEKWTGSDMLAYRGRIDTALLSEFVPPEYLDGREGTHSVRNPATTITESFNQADSTTVGPDLSWTEVQQDWDTFSNQLRKVTGGGQGTIRAESALSSANHRSQVERHGGGLSGYDGPATRFAAAANTCYVGAYWQGGNNYKISKIVAGTRTDLFTGGTEFTLGNVIRLTTDIANLHTLESPVGTTKVSGTNGDITGNLRCGAAAHNDTANGTLFDNFEAADLAAGTTILAVAMTATAQMPNAALVVSPTISAQPMQATAQMPAASVRVDRTVGAAVMTATAGMPDASLSVSPTIGAQVMAATATAPDASLVKSSTIAAQVMTATADSPDASLAIGPVIAAQPMLATAGSPNASLVLSSVILAQAMGATAGMPDASLVKSSTIAAAVMTATALMYAATLSFVAPPAPGIISLAGLYVVNINLAGVYGPNIDLSGLHDPNIDLAGLAK